MPAVSKRRAAARKNAQAMTAKYTVDGVFSNGGGAPSRTYGGVDKDSPLLGPSALPRAERAAAARRDLSALEADPEQDVRHASKRRKSAGPSEPGSEPPVVCECGHRRDQVPSLSSNKAGDARTLRRLEFVIVESLAQVEALGALVTPEERATLEREVLRTTAKAFGIDERTAQTWMEKARNGEDLGDKPRSGAPTKLQQEHLDWFKRRSAELGHVYFISDMAADFKAKFNFGSPYMVRRLQELAGVVAVPRKVRPNNDETDMHNRVGLADWWLRHLPLADHVMCFVDEKWIYAYKDRPSVMYVPQDQLGDERAYTVRADRKNRTTDDKVMFFAAVGEPRPDIGFDGGLYMTDVGEDAVAKKKSAFFEAGDAIRKPANIDQAKFVDYGKKTTDAVAEKIRKAGLAKGLDLKVYIFADNAGGHGVCGNGEREGSIEQLNKYIDKMYKPNGDDGPTNEAYKHVRWETQPANSPDMNVLDLAAWFSVDSRVGEIKRQARDDPNRRPMKEKIRAAFQGAWRKWLEDPGPLQAIYRLLHITCESIVAANGRNDYSRKRIKETAEEREARVKRMTKP